MSDNEYLDYEGLGYLADHINAKDGKKIKKKLRAGDTSLTINDSEITSNSLIDIYSDVHGLNATSVTQGNGTLSITFPAQANDLNVIVIVRDSRNSRVNMYKVDYDANGDVENAGGIADFVDYKIGTKLTATLTAGNTTLTFTNARITSTAFIKIFTNVYGINPRTAVQSGTTLTLTFDALSSDLDVAILIFE